MQVLAPGKAPPKKLTQSGNAADGFVIELKPARGDSKDLLAELVDLVTISGGFTNWDAIQRQLTSKPDGAAQTCCPVRAADTCLSGTCLPSHC